MNNGKGRVLCRDETADLGHDLEESHSPDVRALATHIAPGDDLECVLLRGIVIVRNESVKRLYIVSMLLYLTGLTGKLFHGNLSFDLDRAWNRCTHHIKDRVAG